MSTTTLSPDGATLHEVLMHACRKDLRQVLGDIVRELTPRQISSNLEKAAEIGAFRRVEKPSRWQQHLLSDNMLSSILVFLQDFEKLTLAERVCRRWFDASNTGGGWQIWSLSKHLALKHTHLLQLSSSGRLDRTHTLHILFDFGPLPSTLNWLPRRLDQLVVDVSKATDEHIQQIAASCPKLCSLHLDGGDPDLSENALVPLASLSKLSSLSVYDNVTEEQLFSVSTLPLTQLNVQWQQHPQLVAKSLRFMPTTVTHLDVDRDTLCGQVALLARFPTLTALHCLSNNNCDFAPLRTQQDLDVLVDLRCCKRNSRKELAITVRGKCSFDGLNKVTSLQTLLLDAYEIDVDDNGLAVLAQLQALKWLKLRGDTITDSGLLHLSHAAKLEHLFLFLPNVTNDGVVMLNSRLRLRELGVRGCAKVTVTPTTHFPADGSSTTGGSVNSNIRRMLPCARLL